MDKFNRINNLYTIYNNLLPYDGRTIDQIYHYNDRLLVDTRCFIDDEVHSVWENMDGQENYIDFDDFFNQYEVCILLDTLKKVIEYEIGD